MKTLIKWLRIIGGILVLPFLLLISFIFIVFIELFFPKLKTKLLFHIYYQTQAAGYQQERILNMVGPFFPEFKTKLLFHTYMYQAEAAEARYQQGGGIPALDKAIAAREPVLTHAEFSRVDEKFRLKVSNDSANIYLRRYWARGVLEDLDKALSC